MSMPQGFFFILRRSFLVAAMLMASLTGHANASAAHSTYAEIPLTSDNPLFPFAYDSKNHLLENFSINFETLARYYFWASEGIIRPNPTPVFTSRDRSELYLTTDMLTFQVDTTKLTITPDLPISPESAQSLFIQDDEAYTRRLGGEDFVDAKLKFFKGLGFNEKIQRYQRTMFMMSDWKSLIHPPVRNVGTTTEEQDRYFRTMHTIPQNSSMLNADWNRKIDEISQSELTRGNHTKILLNGDSYREKLARVRAAKKSIYVMVMSFASDPSSFLLIDELIAKAQQGVEVQVVLEKLWTVTVFRNTMKRFTDGGVKLLLANDMFHLFGKRRTLFHNKVWIFDDETAIVGGQNIVNSSNNSTGFNHWNKDIDVMVEGPMVTDILDEFTTLKDRYDVPRSARKVARFNLDQGRTTEELRKTIAERRQKERHAGLRGNENYGQWFSNEDSASDGVCRFVIQGPQKNNLILSKTYSEFFRAAKRELFLTSQHIEYDEDEIDDQDESNDSPTSTMFQSLYDAAANGARVDLVANGIDGGFAEIGQNIAMGRKGQDREARRQIRQARQTARGKNPQSFLKRLSTFLGLRGAKKFKVYLDDAVSRPGVNAWMHFQYVHSKTVLIDNIMASIGSFNFEPFSSEHSHESAIFCYDRQLARDLKTDYIRDIVNSTPVIPEASDLLSDDSTEQN
jgi:phosphatidylserine/phosphatidylglycerophosphate/cardiolipin synthase-like enzyme